MVECVGVVVGERRGRGELRATGGNLWVNCSFTHTYLALLLRERLRVGRELHIETELGINSLHFGQGCLDLEIQLLHVRLCVPRGTEVVQHGRVRLLPLRRPVARHACEGRTEAGGWGRLRTGWTCDGVRPQAEGSDDDEVCGVCVGVQVGCMSTWHDARRLEAS